MLLYYTTHGATLQETASHYQLLLHVIDAAEAAASKQNTALEEIDAHGLPCW